MVDPCRWILFWGLLAVVLPFGATLEAQGKAPGPVLRIGWGSMSPHGPFDPHVSIRGSLGAGLGQHEVLDLEFTAQQGSDLLGLALEHWLARSPRDTPHRRYYAIRLAGGAVFRSTPRVIADSFHLKTAVYASAGIGILYPFTRRFAVVGTLEDILVWSPRQTVGTRWFPQYVWSVGGDVQHNFGFYAALQWRP